jgi:hypothetical protein
MKFFDAFAMANIGDALICGAAHVEKTYSAVETMTALHQRGLFSTVDREDWEVMPKEMLQVVGCSLHVEGKAVRVA